MGGLISNNQSTGEVGVPGLKDVPGVGRLFRSQTFQEDRHGTHRDGYSLRRRRGPREGWELTRQVRERLTLHPAVGARR